jgi:hypothetical protein
VAPAFALAFLAMTTYRVSFGHVLHTDHLPALHLIVLAVAPAADAWSLDHRGASPVAPHERFGWPVEVMGLLTVISYLLAGVAKLRYGGFDWLTGDVLRNQIAYDNLRKVLLGDVHSPVGGWVVRHPLLLRPVAVATVLVELGAFVALGRGWVRAAWAVAAWLFHVGIILLMAIAFPYQLAGVAYAPFFAVERPMARLGARMSRLRVVRRLSMGSTG